MKPAFVFPLALVLALLVTVPVSAAPPVIETGTYDDDSPTFAPSCPGIEVWDHEVLTYRQITYFDKEGNVASIKIHFIGTDTFHNPANPGVELTGQFSVVTEIDLQTGEFIHASGLPVHITVPGYGTVLVRAGFWSRYPFGHEAGKDSLQDPKDMEAFCSLLAGD